MKDPAMAEPSTSAAGGLWLLKAYGIKVLAGAVMAALLFMVLWPRTPREGFARLATSIGGSCLWGDIAVAWVRMHVEWLPTGISTDFAIVAASGAPAWWLLGILARWMDRHRNSTPGEVLDDLRRIGP
jgi:hypothetical protein